MFKGIGSVSIRWNIVWNRWKGTLKARFIRVNLNQGTATLILPVPTFIHQGKYLTNEHARCLFIFQIAVYICASNVRKLTLIVDIFNVEMIEKSFVYRALLQMWDYYSTGICIYNFDSTERHHLLNDKQCMQKRWRFFLLELPHEIGIYLQGTFEKGIWVHSSTWMWEQFS